MLEMFAMSSLHLSVLSASLLVLTAIACSPSDVPTSVVDGEEETTGEPSEPRCRAQRVVQRAHQCRQVARAVEPGERTGDDIANPLMTVGRPESSCVQAGAEFAAYVRGKPTQLHVAP